VAAIFDTSRLLMCIIGPGVDLDVRNTASSVIKSYKYIVADFFCGC
jgi:hypothetical protein